MFFHPVRKSIGLTLLYILIIVGIFALQFRNESVVSKKIGRLAVSLVQSQGSSGEEIRLKNSVKVSFNGISFTADDMTPALITKNVGGERRTEKLTLVSYDQPSLLSARFFFDGGTRITFTASDDSGDATLSVSAELPEDAEEVVLNFKPNSGFTVTEKTDSRQVFSSKSAMFAFSSAKLTDDTLTMTAKAPYAMFSAYDPSLMFTFASVNPDSDFALKSTYEGNLSKFRESLIQGVTDAFSSNGRISESAIVAYVAEMALRGKYDEALSLVPDSFKKDTKRSYVSAPYFGSLEAMSASLKMKTDNMAEMIRVASAPAELSQNALNIFTVLDLGDFIYLFGGTQSVKKLLSLPAELLTGGFNLNVAQAAGILNTYAKIVGYKMDDLAEYLEPVVPACLSAIEERCILSESSLTVTEDDVPIGLPLALEVGSALLDYGTLSGSEEYVASAYAILNTALSANSPDLLTIAENYPLLVKNRKYPHFVMLYRDRNIWTWTSADSVSYTERNNVGTFRIGGKTGEIHYQIVSGIQAFNGISIYGLAYRSDPKFELYASSGYVYRSASKNLFLKTRHKSDVETVELRY